MRAQDKEKRRDWIKAGTAVFSFALVAAVAMADFSTRYETAISLLYLAPLVATAWFSWQGIALVVALLSGVSDVLLSYIMTGSADAMNVLNAGIQTVFFTVFAFVLLALRKSQAHLKTLSRTDPLTGALNSRCFFEAGNLEALRSFRYHHPFSVVFIDIDDFKLVNDKLGHSAGDVLLCDIVKKIQGTIRNTDVLARLGGDEFSVLLPETGEEAAQIAVARIRKSLSSAEAAKPGAVTFSVGLVTNLGVQISFEEVLKMADDLMYEAKRAGKNTLRQTVFCANGSGSHGEKREEDVIHEKK
jgi:diguanylate cyclase (GGDEF)-like protein